MKTREERMFELEYSNEGRVEQCERICKLEEMAREMIDTFRLGCVSGEGISKKWCRELYEKYGKSLREMQSC